MKWRRRNLYRSNVTIIQRQISCLESNFWLIIISIIFILLLFLRNIWRGLLFFSSSKCSDLDLYMIDVWLFIHCNQSNLPVSRHKLGVLWIVDYTCSTKLLLKWDCDGMIIIRSHISIILSTQNSMPLVYGKCSRTRLFLYGSFFLLKM